MIKKKLVTVVLAMSMMVTTFGGTSIPAKAKDLSRLEDPASLDDVVEVGKTWYEHVSTKDEYVKIKGKVKWKVISGKKCLKITKTELDDYRTSSAVWFKGLRAGTAKLQCTNRKDKFIYTIKVVKFKNFTVKKVTPAIAKKIDKYRRKSKFIRIYFKAKSRKEAAKLHYKLNEEIRKQNPYSIALGNWEDISDYARFSRPLIKKAKNTWMHDLYDFDDERNIDEYYKELEPTMKRLFDRGKTLYPDIFSGNGFNRLSEAQQVYYLFDIACRSKSNASKDIWDIMRALGYEYTASYNAGKLSNGYIHVNARNGKDFCIWYYTSDDINKSRTEEQPDEEYLKKYSRQIIEIYKVGHGNKSNSPASLDVLGYLEKYGKN